MCIKCPELIYTCISKMLQCLLVGVSYDLGNLNAVRTLLACLNRAYSIRIELCA